jgi:ATP-dependent DNA helicase PIF1
MNKRLTDFYLPRVIHHWVDDERFPRTAHIRNFNRNEEGQQYEGMAETMNNNQRVVFQNITEAIERSPVTAHFFLEGAGGTGKTYLYRALCSYYRSRLHRDQDNIEIRKFVVCVASTGIAGLLLPGGQTAHSFFAVPLDTTQGSKLRASSEQARLLRDTRLIIWDEVAMQNKEVVEAVDKCLRDITKVNSLFGGIPVVLGGN